MQRSYIKCLELNISETCNYNCKYCVFHRNNKKTVLMDPSTAAQIASDYDRYLDGKKGKIYFGAGEPLLNWDAIVRVCEALKTRRSDIGLFFMTNASLLTPEKLLYLRDNGIRMGFSLDGKPTRQRNTRTPFDPSIDSYDVVINALEWAKRIHYPVFSLSATYNKLGFVPDAEYVMSICAEHNIKEFDLDYDIESLHYDNLAQVATELVECFYKADALGLKTFGYWLIPYLNKLDHSSFHSYCDNASGSSLCISAEGKIKICGYDPISYLDYNSFESVLCSHKLQKALVDYNMRNDECMKCDLYPFCLGQCILHDCNQHSFRNNCSFLHIVTAKMLETHNT